MYAIRSYYAADATAQGAGRRRPHRGAVTARYQPGQPVRRSGVAAKAGQTSLPGIAA